MKKMVLLVLLVPFISAMWQKETELIIDENRIISYDKPLMTVLRERAECHTKCNNRRYSCEFACLKVVPDQYSECMQPCYEEDNVCVITCDYEYELYQRTVPRP